MHTRRQTLLLCLAAAAAFAPACAAPDFAAAMAKLEKRSGGRLGAAVRDRNTGAIYGYRQNERFAMCSTFKTLAVSAVLAKADAGKEDLNREIHYGTKDLVIYSPVTQRRIAEGMTLDALCEAAMTQSDNAAANLILASLGGPAAVTAFARSLDDTVTRLDRTEPTLNIVAKGDERDTTSPAAMAGNLEKLLFSDKLSPASRARLADWLARNATGGARIRAGVPATWKVGDKTGSGAFGSTNDVAVLTPPSRAPVIVAAYLTQTGRPSTECEAILAAVGRLVAERI